MKIQNAYCDPLHKIISFLVLVIILNVSTPSFAQLQGSFESKHKRYQKGEAFTGTPINIWKDTAWKGDRLYKQIILWSPINVNNLTYEVSTLTSTANAMPNSVVHLRFNSYIIGDELARGCSQYPTRPSQVLIADALSENQITTLTSTDPIKMWVSMDIPPAALSGIYTGTIKVKSNGLVKASFIIEVEVINTLLPPPGQWAFFLDLWQYPYNTLGWYNYNHPSEKIASYTDAYFKMIKPYYKLLADAGQKSITVTLPNGEDWKQRFIKWIKGTDGKWQYDFTHFDRTVDSMTSWGISHQITCLEMANKWKSTLWYWDVASNSYLSINAPVGSTAFNDMWGNFLPAFRTHLIAKGWFDIAVLWMDELDESTMLQVIPIIRADNNNWKIGRAGDAVSTNVSSNLFNSSIFYWSGSAPPAGNRPAGAISTWYTSCTIQVPNNFVTVQNNPAEMSWLCWNISKNNLDGYLRWAYDFWQLNDPANAQDTQNTSGDLSMVYRASNDTPSIAVSSMRMEMLRDGIQDFEKIRILKAAFAGTTSNPNLVKLNTAINAFEPATATNSSNMVTNGQSVLKDLATQLPSNIILPVRLISFTGNTSGCFANLTWKTANESNSSFYAVEASTDGINFLQVGKVVSKNSIAGSAYFYSQALVGGTTYYFRLKAVDIDYLNTYSQIITVRGAGTCSFGQMVSVAPNPTNDKLTVSGLKIGSHLILIDNNNRQLFKSIASGNQQIISLSGYAAGLYVLQVQSANGTIENFKVVKK